MLISASATGLQSFYQFDGLGSVTTVPDGAASQKASYVYDPWGSVTRGADLLGAKNKFTFTGEAVDSATGLVFLRARCYDSITGRFLSQDKVAESLVLPATWFG
jgi:RHS repeat-associated protein